MWHSIEREKSDDFDRLPAGPSPQRHGQVGEEDQWTDVKWRECYLERMERREYVSLSLLYSSLGPTSSQSRAESKYKFCSTCSSLSSRSPSHFQRKLQPIQLRFLSIARQSHTQPAISHNLNASYHPRDCRPLEGFLKVLVSP
jgi:hypothetical protein